MKNKDKKAKCKDSWKDFNFKLRAWTKEEVLADRPKTAYEWAVK